MVRRLKEDIRATQGGLPERRVERVVIDGLSPDAPELELSRLLDECRTAREERHAHTSNKAQAAAGLLVVGLQQRLLSSVEAFARSLAVHRRTVERHWEQEQADNAAGKEPGPPAGTGQASEQESPAPANDETHDLFLTPPAADDERGEQEADLIEAEEEVQIEAITWPRNPRRRRITARSTRSCGGRSSSCSTGCRRSLSGPATSPTRRPAGSSTGSASTCARPCRRSAASPPGCRRAGTIVASSSSRRTARGRSAI